MHPFGLQMTCWQRQSESSITKETEWRLRGQLEQDFFNLAQLRFLTEAVDATFPGWENGKTTVKLAQHCLCTVWCYLILIPTELLQRRGLLAEGWERRQMSAASKTFVHSVSQSRAPKYSSAAIRELYQQRPRKLLIRQYISPRHWRLPSHPVPNRVSHPKCFPGGQRGEKCHGQFDFNHTTPCCHTLLRGMRPKKRVQPQFCCSPQGKSDVGLCGLHLPPRFTCSLSARCCWLSSMPLIISLFYWT